MRYDPDLKEFYFNTEMILSSEGRQELRDTYDDWLCSLRNNPGQTFRTLATGMRPSSDGSKPGATPFQLFMSIVIIVIFLGFIGCCITNRFNIAAWVGAGFLALLGFLMIFSNGNSSDNSVYNKTESSHGLPIFTRLQGVLFLIASGAVIYLRLNIKYYTQSEIFLRVFAGAFAVFGLMFVINGISRLLAGKQVYTEEVNATCIGYLRTYEAQGEHGLSVRTSPVFEYYYQGEQFKSVYDIFTNKPNGTIPVGSSTVIRIDPRSPEHVMGNSKSSGITFLVIGIFVALVSIVPIMIILTGHANEGELRMSGIAAPQYDSYISDELVTKEYGDDWYIEKLKIASVTKEKAGDTEYLHVIVDDSFKEINTTLDFGYEEGQEVYVIYRMTTIDGELKKEALNFTKAEGTGYKGAHKAYR